MGWICATVKSSDIPSPFQCTPMVFTLGYLVILILVVPMGIINLDDNIWVQMGSFLLAILIGLQWIVSAILTGPDPSRVPWFSSSPLGYGMTLGTVMLNLGFTTVVPSWINIKKKDVSAQKLVWTSVFAAFGYYTLLGAILALSYTPNISGTVLPDLMTQGVPVLLTKITVYMYSFVMLVTSIPVSCIVTYNNIVQNNVLPKRKRPLTAYKYTNADKFK